MSLRNIAHPDRPGRLPVDQRTHRPWRSFLRADQARSRLLSTTSLASPVRAARLYWLPAPRSRRLPHRRRPGVRHRPAARQEDPRHARHRLQLVSLDHPGSSPSPDTGVLSEAIGPHRRLPSDKRPDLGGRRTTVAVVAAGGVVGPRTQGAAGWLSPRPRHVSVGDLPGHAVSGSLAMGLLVAWLVTHPGAHHLARPFVGESVSRWLDDLLDARRHPSDSATVTSSWPSSCRGKPSSSASWPSAWASSSVAAPGGHRRRTGGFVTTALSSPSAPPSVPPDDT